MKLDALAGTTVCITGGAKGLGRAAAWELASRGAEVIILDADVSAAHSAAEGIRSGGHQASVYPCDLRNPTAIAAAFAGIEGAFGGLDALVNNAGVFPRVTFDEMSSSAIDEVLEVNFRGAVLCTGAAFAMLQRRHGTVIFIGSSAAEARSLNPESAPYFQLYGASKAAVERWALGSSPVLGAAGVGTVVLRPGRPLLTEGTMAMGLSQEEMAGYVDPAFVGVAIAWLLAQPPGTFSGHLLSARDFGVTWGQLTTEWAPKSLGATDDAGRPT